MQNKPDELTDELRQIADVVREPVNLPQWPTMEVEQPDGSVRTVPVPATWHSTRRRHINLFPPKPGLIFRVKRWLI